ncbi:tyrosine-type recombinase/integrase [Rhodococcus sp. SORGH_AS_0303]|uniref:tyrosine-type recombinase/integrase n=1 Tax=Rhodococcus sp. SORGH_AS_0303 TaxID=3041753 RepID=UPI002781DDE2|nr:tyrosine-type recombinase/integrase [Rhodococcus sp. SORGH_AS_0303]MDQ1202703.1 integrase [Rhodococcus sp. SORGH_AS_0303]
MAYIRAHETTAKSRGKAIKRYEVIWKEPVLDEMGLPVPADPAQPSGRKKTRARQESFATREDAEARRDELNAARHHVTAQSPSEMRKLGDQSLTAFAHRYFEGLVGTVKPRYAKEVQSVYRRYVEGSLGNKPVAAITAADLRRFRAELLSPRPKRSYDTRSAAPAQPTEMVTLARTTIKPAWECLQRILDLAVVDGAIPSNPMLSAKLPRSNGAASAAPGEEPFTARPMTAQQIGAVADHIRSELRRPIDALAVTFAAFTGVRAGELQGLNVGDLALGPMAGSGGSVRVQRTRRPVCGSWETGTPKSRKSRRKVPVDGWLADDLRTYLASVHPHGDELSADYDPDAPLFPGRHTRASAVAAGIDVRDPATMYRWDVPLTCANVYRRCLQPALVALNLRHSRWHDLRHAFAVMSLSAGEHYMQVSKWLGHASYVTTLTVYADYIAENEGGKQAPLTRPTAPADRAPAPSNVVPLFGRLG